MRSACLPFFLLALSWWTTPNSCSHRPACQCAPTGYKLMALTEPDCDELFLQCLLRLRVLPFFQEDPPRLRTPDRSQDHGANSVRVAIADHFHRFLRRPSPGNSRQRFGPLEFDAPAQILRLPHRASPQGIGGSHRIVRRNRSGALSATPGKACQRPHIAFWIR